MRIIDSHALSTDIEMLPFYVCQSGIKRQLGTSINDHTMFRNGETLVKYKDIVDAIYKAPTVDAVEVVHAMWIKELRGIVRCSYCGRGYRITNGGANVLKFFYCPNCGAKMDVKDTNVPTKDDKED